MHYFLLVKVKKKKAKKTKSMLLNKEYKWPREKEFFKSFAKQSDIFTVLNFTT